MNEEEKDLINLKIAISPEKYIRELLKENQELKKQLEHYKNKEIERINENVLLLENEYLDRCIKANIGGNISE